MEEEENRDDAEDVDNEDDRYVQDLYSATNGELLNLDSINDHYISSSSSIQIPTNESVSITSSPDTSTKLPAHQPFENSDQLQRLLKLEEPSKKKSRESFSSSILESLQTSENYLKTSLSLPSRTNSSQNPLISNRLPIQYTHFISDETKSRDIPFEALDEGFELPP